MSFYCTDTKTHWTTCVCLTDLMAFFPSCEQVDFPELRGRPVAVTNGDKGTTIISSSYEAREYGIKTGMKMSEALKLCPQLIKRPSRPDRYAEISGNIMRALMEITPDISVYSIDECYIDLMPVLKLYGSVKIISEKIRKTVFEASGGIRCSIGITEGQLTAKYCAKNKGETTIVTPGQIKSYIGRASIGDICGIGKNIERYLNQYGILKCADIERFPMSILSNRFGDIGRRLYSVCLGHDPLPVDTTDKDHKSMGHGKVTAGENDRDVIRGIMRQLVERLTRRMRHHKVVSDLFFIGFKTAKGWVGHKYKVQPATNSTSVIWSYVQTHFKSWHHEALYQVQVTALSLQSSEIRQLDLFEDLLAPDPKVTKHDKLDDVKDLVNDRFGKHTLRSAAELLADKANMVPVIAFNFDATGKKNSL
ncbi:MULTISPECIES: DNA polymerase thumb domain-containing protein [Cysteiniphilum]|uniref:DNA polymerase Y family protein n=1 Tax=Cysteiniphilum TaxID=2056696 RepID=UPI0017864B6D|nr:MULTISPECIES: DNA polymerase IV [Cysteiniphilum]